MTIHEISRLAGYYFDFIKAKFFGCIISIGIEIDLFMGGEGSP